MDQSKRPIGSILFSLAGDENTASTRIRFFSMLPWLKKMNIKWSTELSIKQLLNSDLFFVQKRLNGNILKIAGLAKLLGIPIVYDVDDFGQALDYFASQNHLQIMFELADLITVGSDAQKAIVEREYRKNNTQVFPPLIDYYPQAPLRSPDIEDEPLRILWFGLASNFAPLAQLIEKVSMRPLVELVVITEAEAIPNLRQQFPNIHFHTWSLETFIPTLRTCHLSVLSHDGGKYVQAKTNNKMITSINWGVPALVSDTPDYRMTVNKLGIRDCVFTNLEVFLRLIDLYRSRQARETYLENAQSIIWQLYSPELITQFFLDFCSEIKIDCFYKRFYCFIKQLIFHLLIKIL